MGPLMPPGRTKGSVPEETSRRRCQSRCKGSVEDAGSMLVVPEERRRSRPSEFSRSSRLGPSTEIEGAPIAEEHECPRSSQKIARGEELEEQSVDDGVIKSSVD